MENPSAVSRPSGSRDPGLDAIRAMALFLMVAAHSFRQYLPVDDFSRNLRFVYESSPAFFFFAFGMSADRFNRKESRIKVEQLLLFFYVAIAHNSTFSGGLLQRGFLLDFLLCLWAWRVILALLEWDRKVSNRAYLIFCGCGFVLLTLLPPAFFSSLTDGEFWSFPLLPWGLYIICGLIYVRMEKRRTRVWALAGAVAICLGFIIWYRLAGGPGGFFAKSPQTAAYFALFVTAAGLLVEAVRGLERWYRALPGVPGLVEFASRDLLLAFAIHYTVAYHVPRLVAFLLSGRGGQLSAMPAWGVIVIPLIGLGLTLAGTWAILSIWARLAELHPFRAARVNFHLTAVLLLIGLFALCNLKIYFNDPASIPIFGLGPGSALPGLLTRGVRDYAIILLVYFTLELMRHRAGPEKPRGAGAGGAGSGSGLGPGRRQRR